MTINWLLLSEIGYIIVLVLVCLRIVWDTRSSVKTLAYMLLVIFLPLAGMFIYFSFGINYRKRKLYTKKLIQDDKLVASLNEKLETYYQQTVEENRDALAYGKKLANLLVKSNTSIVTGHNDVKLLLNGEQKFPEVLKALEAATNHIHIEYYIYENDEIGNAIADVLIKKATEGVTVRFMYDDFGSRSVRGKLVKRLRNAGVQAFPFYKIKLLALANRMNYRNHRKIIVVDGKTAFVGGINVSDKYINNHKEKLYWRDTHLRIDGPGIHYLQYLFLCDWNFCAGESLQPDEQFFPRPESFSTAGNKLVQIAASGPDSDEPIILFSLLQAINAATEELLITTPYFIPGDTILEAIMTAALSGVKVKLLVPGKSDSMIVNAAAHSYYTDLLHAGAEVYCYQKGFVHAKTMVADKKIAIVGSANMDYRSFDLNFEVNAIVYDEGIASELAEAFYNDLKDATKIELAEWEKRSGWKQFFEKIARLVSPML